MSSSKPENAIRLAARILSGGSLLMLSVLVLGHLNTPSAPPTMVEWLGLAFFPVGIMIGLLIALRKDLLGGGIAALSLLGFYAWHMLVAGRLPQGPWFVGIAAPGFLHLLAGVLACRRLSRSSDRSGGAAARRLPT